MQEDEEISWHRSQIAKNRELIEELLAGNTEGSNVFPETQAEIDRLKAQTAQSQLIVAGYVKEEMNQHGKDAESQKEAQEGRNLRNEGRIEDGKEPKNTKPGTGQ